MTAMLDVRVTTLEEKVEYLETFGGPGQLQALSDNLVEFRQEVSVRLDRLESDVATLKTDVASLKTDVATLKTDVATLKTDVTALKTDVATLTLKVDTVQAEVTELKREFLAFSSGVSASITEILDRLPPKAA